MQSLFSEVAITMLDPITGLVALYLANGAKKAWDRRDEAVEFLEGLKVSSAYGALCTALTVVLFCDF